MISPCENCSCEGECQQVSVVKELDRLYSRVAELEQLLELAENEAVEAAIYRDMEDNG